MPSGGYSFPAGFDQRLTLSGEHGNEAFVGRDVLRGLVEGIRQHVASHAGRRSWRRQPALIGCSPWCNDHELLLALQQLHVCVVVRKWPRRMEPGLERLEQFNGAARASHFGPSDLALHAPKVDGAPAVIGPNGVDNDIYLSPFRTLGFREADGGGRPMAHAKLALLGDLWHHDEEPATRLVTSSASARGACGCRRPTSPTPPAATWSSASGPTTRPWCGEPKRFIVALIGASEQLRAESDTFEPDLAEGELDMEAIAEYAAEFGAWGDEDDEDASAEEEEWPPRVRP